MQNMSDGYNLIANSDSALYYTTIKYGSTTLDITLNDFKYIGMMQSDDDLTIGGTCSAQISFSLYNPSISLANKEIEVYEGIMVNGTLESVRLGYFTIQKPTVKGDLVTYNGYDRMVIKTTGVYASSLTFPTNTKAVMNEISNKTGITFDTVLPTTISIATKPMGYTYREMIGYIAALHGKNAIINRNGHMEFKWYSSVSYSIDSSRYYENGVTLDDEENYILGKISCTVKGTDSTTTLVSGTSGHGISIENPFMTQTILDSIFSSIGNFTYRPLSVRFLGDFRLDLGDIITVTQGTDTYSVPIMKITHEWDGGAISEVKSIGKTTTESEMDVRGPFTKAMDRYYGELVLMNQAIINKLDVDTANITYATIDSLNAVTAVVEDLTATSITVDYANLHYANIDFANVEKASVGTLLANIGLITSATIENGHVTGYLDSVEINANKITAGTLTVDRLILSGDNGSILYALNNLGELTSTNFDSLDGDVLTDRTVTCDKLVAHSITANEIASSTITAQQIASQTITSAQVDSSITTTSVFEAAFANLNASINNAVYDCTEIPTLSNYPINTWGSILPSDTLYPLSTLYPLNADNKVLLANVGCFANVNNTTVYRLKQNGDTFIWDDVTDTPEGYVIRGYNSNIASLSLKVNSDELCSELSGSADLITFTGNRFVVNSDNFNLDRYGNLTCNNLTATNGTFSGVVNATSGSFTGTVNATSGSIGGIPIDENGILLKSGTFSTFRINNNSSLGQIGSSFFSVKSGTSESNSSLSYLTNEGFFYAKKIGTGNLTPTNVGAYATYDLLSSNGYITNLDVNKFYTEGVSKFNGTVRFYEAVYNSSGGTVFTSDENAKHDIEALDIEDSASFIYSLNPVSYKFNVNDSDRKHHGLIAQTVKECMADNDWGLYIDEKYSMNNPTLDDNGNVLNEDGTIKPTKGLRYDELIADLIATVQSQNKRILALENLIATNNLSLGN